MTARRPGVKAVPEWLCSQLRRAFKNRDVKAVRMLNQAFFRYRTMKP
ncbi:cortex morphogenetic protein CmpA [Alicyclobacillus shizuokensis]|nr:cortex morphogenetic protein CmpA [Alicyclobacillus shizuokensis]